MCGIAGFVGRGPPDLIGRMTAVLDHRGPDDRGTAYFDGSPPAALGSTRLAIQDLSAAAHQPMRSHDGRLTLVFNGEIYNFPDLRAELEGKGHRFRSHGDTEVVLTLYQRHGPAMLERLNGMFAMAIWDAAAGELFLARDRFGEKPLYLFQPDASLYFASEVKAFLQVPTFEPHPNHTSLLKYLTFLWVPEPSSIFQGVQKLPAGHFGIFRAGRLTIERYWDLAVGQPIPGDPEEIAAEVRRRLVLSVSRRLVSDRPVGAFLSGGIDSSTMLVAMAEASSGPVQTYTIGFRPVDYTHETVGSEVPLARAVAERVGARWEHIELDARSTHLLPSVIWHLDEPVADPAAIGTYMLCRAAKPTCSVLLSGMGGDEVFGGYRRHLAFRLTEAYNRLPALLRQRALPAAVNLLARITTGPLAGPIRDARLFLRYAGLPLEQRFAGYARYYAPGQLEALLAPDLRELAHRVHVESAHAEHFRATEGADPLARMLYVDLKTFMASLTLLYLDKMAMAMSVEGRLPFLDHELVQFAAGIPSDLKVRGLTTKWILRKAFEKDLPRNVTWNRRKFGFGAPIRTWLSRDLREMSRDILSPDRVRARGLFDPDGVQRILAEPLYERNCFRIWALMTLELWMQRFADGARGRAFPIEAPVAQLAS